MLTGGFLPQTAMANYAATFPRPNPAVKASKGNRLAL
jgi:hypothetical protein